MAFAPEWHLWGGVVFYQGEEKEEESLSRHKSYVKEVFLVYLQDPQQPWGRNDCPVQILSFSFFGAELPVLPFVL